MIRLILVSAALAFSLSACDKKPKSEPQSTTPPAATTVSQLAASNALRDDEIATEEDFEDEAEREINLANLEAELEKLEKEIQ